MGQGLNVGNSPETSVAGAEGGREEGSSRKEVGQVMGADQEGPAGPGRVLAFNLCDGSLRRVWCREGR